MDFSHYTDEPVELAIALVNSFETFAEVEHLNTPEDLVAFVREHSSEWGHDSIDVTEADVDAVKRFRSRLREAITARDVDRSAHVLNALLDEADARPRVSVHDGSEPHLHFEPADAGLVRWLGAVTAMGLSIVLVEEGLDRFGVCDSDACGDVYVDASRNRSRRHCSDRCTTRENVAAYRRRRRSESEGA
jgi:predicted RNA-binding Zn ribbon-like protein